MPLDRVGDRVRSVRRTWFGKGLGAGQRFAIVTAALCVLIGCRADRPALPGPIGSPPPTAPDAAAGSAAAAEWTDEEPTDEEPTDEEPTDEEPTDEGTPSEETPEESGDLADTTSGAAEGTEPDRDGSALSIADPVIASDDELLAARDDAVDSGPIEPEVAAATAAPSGASSDSDAADTVADASDPGGGTTAPDEAPGPDPDAEGSSAESSEDPEAVARREMEAAAAAAIQEALSAAAIAAPEREPVVDHSAFDAILRATVRGDRVDYERLKTQHAGALKAYLDALASVDDEALEWEEERLAFYINLYNASMFQAVLDRYTEGWTPAADSFAVFDEKLVRMKGRQVSLNHLENEIVRKEFTEPRIHVALVCGARSCPQIRDRAYDPKSLDEMLDENMRTFLASGFRNRIDRRNRKLMLSQLFEWYADDFGGKDQVASYVDRYVSGDVSGYRVEFIEYSWELNSPR